MSFVEKVDIQKKKKNEKTKEQKTKGKKEYEIMFGLVFIKRGIL